MRVRSLRWSISTSGSDNRVVTKATDCEMVVLVSRACSTCAADSTLQVDAVAWCPRAARPFAIAEATLVPVSGGTIG